MSRACLGLSQTSANKQRGAILVVAMVLLLVMSLIGIGSRVNSTLQQKMSVAYQHQGVARIGAEAALRAAEAFMVANITSTVNLSDFDGNTLGLYSTYYVPGEINNVAPAAAAIADTADDGLWDAANSIAVADYDASAANQPRYIIEYVGRDKGTADKKVVDYNDPNLASNSDPHVFEITAIGWSRDNRIYSVLQSSFSTGYGPGNFTY